MTPLLTAIAHHHASTAVVAFIAFMALCFVLIIIALTALLWEGHRRESAPRADLGVAPPLMDDRDPVLHPPADFDG